MSEQSEQVWQNLHNSLERTASERDAARARVAELEAQVAEIPDLLLIAHMQGAEQAKDQIQALRAQIESLDCRLVGRVAELSGSHCPADNPCDRCVAERRIAGLEAWQLAIAEGTQFINRAEGQDGYEVADPQTILKYFESPARMTAFLALNPKR